MSGRDLLDEEEFRVFYEETAPGLLAYLRRMVGPGGGAEEIVQEAYLRWLESAPAGLDPARRRAWVYTTASRLARARWRRRELDRRTRRETVRPSGSEPPQDRGVDLERALRRLSARERAMLWLAYGEERSHREIGEVLDLRAASVKVLLFRARRRLEKVLRAMDTNQKER